jgi:hypothetical protein
MTQGPSTRMDTARDPVLLGAGAVLLVCAPVLPGPARLVVLPALLLAPGYALLRLLGHGGDARSISIAIPTSLAIIACVSMALDVSGVRLGAVSLGLVLGGLTAVFLAGSIRRQRVGGQGLHRADTLDERR